MPKKKKAEDEKAKVHEKTLREQATDLLIGRDDLRLDEIETTGNFSYKQYPDVVGVIVDKGSKRGWVQISGEEGDGVIQIFTGRGETDCVFADVSDGQTCMLYGGAKVIWVLAA